ncbi:MAG TPA: Na/Pi cotransporter family protein [Candidatus Deferrimicrobiaceae bacterium]
MMDRLFLQVIGGVFLLLYGVRLTGQGFELAFGSTLSRAWASGGGSRARAFVAGVLGTAALQSSGALVTLLISFAQVSTLPLSRSLTTVLGADLGSTLTVQVLSFRIYQYAFPVLSVGIALFLWGRKGKARAVGQGILGFGLVLLALRFLADAAGDVGRIEGLRILIASFSGAPFTGFIWGLALSVLLQSGTAVMILLIAFAQQGLLAPPAILPLVLGANVGGTSVAFVAASGLAAEGKRVAWGHLALKASGALLFLPFLPLAERAIASVSRDGGHFVANAHTCLNLSLAVVFAPWVGKIAAFLTRMIPEGEEAVPRGKPVYLDREHLPVAGAALGQVAREIVRMADMIEEMHDDAVEAICGMDISRLERIAKADDEVDRLTREIKVFLSTLGEETLDSGQTLRAVAYIAIVSDLENIGDFIDKTVTDHLRRLSERGQRFSEEGGAELRSFLGEISSLYREAISAFVTRDPSAARNVIGRRKEITAMERDLRLAHIRRLQKGMHESLESSAAHLDILSSWKGIAYHCASIAHAVLQMEG